MTGDVCGGASSCGVSLAVVGENPSSTTDMVVSIGSITGGACCT